MIDCFAGTGSTMVAAMSLGKHRRFIGCDKYEDVIDTVDQDMTVCYAEHLLRAESDIATTYHTYLEAARTVTQNNRQNQINTRYDA